MNYPHLHKLKSLSHVLAAFFVFAFSSSVFASGGYGGGSGSFSSSTPTREVDPTYERGKSLFSGRIEGVQKIKYCVADGEEYTKVKRSSLKAYKESTYNILLSSLRNCDSLENGMLDYLNTDQAVHVIYYLDKRYKLDLERS